MQQQQKHDNPPHRKENDATSPETAVQHIEDDAEKFVEEAQALVSDTQVGWYASALLYHTHSSLWVSGVGGLCSPGLSPGCHDNKGISRKSVSLVTHYHVCSQRDRRYTGTFRRTRCVCYCHFLAGRFAFRGDHDSCRLSYEWYIRCTHQVSCGASSSHCTSGRYHLGCHWKQFPQRSCYVLRGILGSAFLFRPHPLQGAPLVANHTPDSFRTVGGPCWSFACLPGSPLDKRCFGRLHVGWCLSGYLVVDLSLSKRERDTCSKTQ